MSNVFKDNSDNLAALASALLAKDMSIVESNRRAADEAILFHKDAIALVLKAPAPACHERHRDFLPPCLE